MKRLIYAPLAREIHQSTDEGSLKLNAKTRKQKDSLAKALREGRIVFWRGEFKGKLSSTLTKELRSIGAQYDRRTKSYRLYSAQLPKDLRQAVAVSQHRMEKTLAGLDKKLSEMSPVKIADSIKFDDLIRLTVMRHEKDLAATMKGIRVMPKLSPEQLDFIAQDYTTNMQRYIKDWAEEEIVKLRELVQKQTLTGARYDSLARIIKDSYGVSKNKAKFLARQETNLYLTSLKETRYKAAGVEEYVWRTVKGTPAHPVRPEHKVLDGQTFNWNNPPVTSKDGRRNHPGEDYNCRCFAQPIVRI